MNTASWIWLPRESYPNYQTTVFSTFCKNKQTDGNYCVAKVFHTYRFPKDIRQAQLTLSADTAMLLKCNGETVARGPVTTGGDYAQMTAPVQYFTSSVDISPVGNTLCLEATVRMMPQRMCELSKGHGGFFLSGNVQLSDGSIHTIGTDESWQIQLLTQYQAYGVYDQRIPQAPVTNAQITEDIWFAEPAPIPCCSYNLLLPENHRIPVKAGETISLSIPFDRIYAGYLYLKTENTANLSVRIQCYECSPGDIRNKEFTFVFCKDTEYEGMSMQSIGGYQLEAINRSTQDCYLTVGQITSCYPVSVQAKTKTSDPELNTVLDVCAHSLQYCRQTHHLDCPSHCEGLSDPGDYYVLMNMTACSFGDQQLTMFDLKRIAKMLESTDGVMFHTTYSLIWVKMLQDAYMFTGSMELLEYCSKAVQILLNRFDSYLGENGLVEAPPSYMFVDWLFIDGLSAHHPPKALGQTCMNLFLYGAFSAAEKIFDALDRQEDALKYRSKANALSEAIVQHLYDPERGLFFEGLNTPTPEHLVYTYMPQNVTKRYYRRHANILAAFYGIFDKEASRALLERVYCNDCLGEVQPYFMHYWLDAIRRNDLHGTQLLPLLNLWKTSVAECQKGLVEGFYKPEPSYHFDHSHAWGGTPLYALPMALSGLEILEPGYKRIRLRPDLLGLDWADVEIPTPYGMIRLVLRPGVAPVITAPKEIEIVTEK